MNAEQKKVIDELYYELYQRLMRYADSSLNNIALAEEAVQEAFAIACSKPDEICSSPNPRGWMVSATANVVRNIERRQQSVRRIVAEVVEYRPDLAAAPEEGVDLRLLYEDLAETSEFQMIYAMAVEGKSLVELAEELHISVDSCKKRVERARKFLQKRIKFMSPFDGLLTYIRRKEAKRCPR